VVGRADVAEQPDVRRHRLVVPAVAGQQERAVRQQGRRAQEELLHARLAVGQPVGQQREVDVEPRVGSVGWCVVGSSAL
jgi:hypothetical protein